MLRLQAPIPNHLYSTRGGRARSDADGYIDEVDAASQMLADLIAAGCWVVPPSAAPPAEDLPEPVA